MAFHIKSFRGKLDDGAQETLSLHTNNGRIGYRIFKFQLIPDTPGTNQTEAIVKIYTVPQTTITNTIDFSDETLAAAIFQAVSNGSNEAYSESIVTIFDTKVFNQDIFITAKENSGARATNYYIELEQFVLNENENTVATLKDIRSNATTQ